jgi:ectoine hydroxylase-related dioxygenase (phytanoyl-CoA dioxygenase family)
MKSDKVNLFHEHAVVKEPGTKDRTPWHHDQPYYCVDGDDNVSLWIPLDPVPEERAVEFIRGSHKWGRWFTPTKFIGVDYERDDEGFETMPDIEAERHKYDIVSFGLEPGDCGQRFGQHLAPRHLLPLDR